MPSHFNCWVPSQRSSTGPGQMEGTERKTHKSSLRRPGTIPSGPGLRCLSVSQYTGVTRCVSPDALCKVQAGPRIKPLHKPEGLKLLHAAE